MVWLRIILSENYNLREQRWKRVDLLGEHGMMAEGNIINFAFIGGIQYE